MIAALSLRAERLGPREDTAVLREVSLEVRKGDTAALVGANPEIRYK